MKVGRKGEMGSVCLTVLFVCVKMCVDHSPAGFLLGLTFLRAPMILAP